MLSTVLLYDCAQTNQKKESVVLYLRVTMGTTHSPVVSRTIGGFKNAFADLVGTSRDVTIELFPPFGQTTQDEEADSRNGFVTAAQGARACRGQAKGLWRGVVKRAGGESGC